MNIIKRILRSTILFLVVAASIVLLWCVLVSPRPLQSREIQHSEWLSNPLTGLSTRESGWQLTNESGGASSGSGCFHARILLKGKTSSESMSELQTLIKARVKEAGFTNILTGSTSSGTELTGFSFSAQSPHSIGTIVVSSASIDSSSLVIAIAVSQRLK